MADDAAGAASNFFEDEARPHSRLPRLTSPCHDLLRGSFLQGCEASERVLLSSPNPFWLPLFVRFRPFGGCLGKARAAPGMWRF